MAAKDDPRCPAVHGQLFVQALTLQLCNVGMSNFTAGRVMGQQ